MFIIDISKSMLDRSDPVSKKARRSTLQDELRGAQQRADEIISGVVDAPDVDVSLWTFGEKDRFNRISGPVTPAEAKREFDAFFSANSPRFTHNWTYIAHSLFRITGEVLSLKDWTPDRDIPDNGGSVFAFVLTDGSESFGQPFDNSPYVEWQRRQQNRMQLVWRKWTLFGDHSDWSKSASGARVTYAVQQMLPTISPLNLSRLPADNVASLDRIPVELRLVPQILADASLSTVEVNGDYKTVGTSAATCESSGAPATVTGGMIPVQAHVDWSPVGPVQATPAWTIAAPKRENTKQGLTLEIGERPGASIPTPSSLSVGQRFPVRMDKDQLCAGLKQLYPGSAFLFAQDGEATGQLPALGFVEVFRRPVYKFLLSAREGTVATAPFDSLVANRWHVYRGTSRSYQVSAESPLDADVQYDAIVLRNGEPVSNGTVLAAMRPTTADSVAATGLSATVPTGTAVVLSLPPRKQTWLDVTRGRGFHWPPGDYTVRVCATPRLRNRPEESYEVETRCEGCERKALSNKDGGVCADASVHVAARPTSWWVIGCALLLIAVAAWSWWRWVTRPLFREGLSVGHLTRYADLRSAQGGPWNTFWRHPGYVELLPAGRTVYMREFLVDPSTNANVVLGIAPNPETPSDDLLVWCAALPTTPSEKRVMCGSKLLTAAGPRPELFGDLVANIGYGKLPLVVTVNSPDKRTPDTYEIQLSSRGSLQ